MRSAVNQPALAFYAPMKSPRSQRPSGDRKIARLLMTALQAAGFDVQLASELRSWEGGGNRDAQQQIRDTALTAADELVAHYLAMPQQQRPLAWFTYHLYHKAPDWIGPRVSRALDIPYFVAEASVAARQRAGQWQSGYQASLDAITHARGLFTLNPADRQGLVAAGCATERIIPLKPFLDEPAIEPGQKQQHRMDIAARLRIDPNRYWLLSVAMMRDDSKLLSYEQLSRIMAKLQRKDWLLLIIGDGAAALQVRDYFRYNHEINQQIYFLGKQGAALIRELMAASDLLVWPAVNEAIGMVVLEALSAGLPAVCGRSGGVDQILHDGRTGMLIDHPADTQAAARFASAIESLMQEPARLAAMSAACIELFHAEHGMNAVSAILRQAINRSINLPDQTLE